MAAKPRYRVLRSLMYTPAKMDGRPVHIRRAAIGEIVADLPASSIVWLTQQEIIEPAAATRRSRNEEGEPDGDPR